MITVKNTNFYTELALKSFFKNTNVNDEDEFILIDNDGCNLNKFSIYNKIKIIKNTKPLSFAANVNQIIDIAKKVKKDLIFLTNDIIFTKDWVNPLLINDETVSIPSNNQIFQYSSECGNLKLNDTICSQVKTLVILEDILIFNFVIKKEIQIIFDLCDKKGIKNE